MSHAKQGNREIVRYATLNFPTQGRGRACDLEFRFRFHESEQSGLVSGCARGWLWGNGLGWLDFFPCFGVVGKTVVDANEASLAK